MTNLDSILKSRDMSLLTKVHLVKAMVFPVVMYGCEIWTIRKAERQRIDAFEDIENCLLEMLKAGFKTVYTLQLCIFEEKILGENTPVGRSNQPILKEINPTYSLGGLMAEAEAPVLWPPDEKSQLIGKDTDAGKD